MKKVYTILLVSILFSLFIQTESKANATATFSDVSPTAYYAEAVQWAQSNGIVSGYPDLTFRPDEPVTEEQFIKIYTNFFKFQPDTSAIATEHWSNVFYRTLDHYDIQVLGTQLQNLKATPITRGAVAELLGYAQGTKRDIPEAIQFLFEKGITNGKYPNKANLLDKYGASESLTRGEIVAFLHRLNNAGMHTLHENVIEAKKSNLPTNKFNQKYPVKFHLINDLYVGVLNTKPKQLTLELFIDQTAVAGYFTAKNKKVNNFVIGKTYSNGDIFSETKNNIVYTYYFDHLNNNQLIGVFWNLKSFEPSKYFNGKKTAKETVQFSKLALLLTNEYRAKNGINELAFYEPLSYVGYNHTLDMVDNNYFAHHDLKGKDVYYRTTQAGLAYQFIEKHGLVGENIAKIPNPNGLFDAHNEWINSQQHRQHILYPHYTHMGLGLTDDIYTNLFISPKY